MSVPPVLIGWLATYALHSTILLGFVLLVSSRLGSDAWRETLWKTALLGGLLTAMLQSAAGYTPLGGRWVLQDDLASPPPAHEPGRQPQAPDVAATGQGQGVRLGRAAQAAGRGVADERRESTPPAGPGARARLADEGAPGAEIPWAALVMGAWVGVAALLLGRLALQHFWLSRVLAGRRPLSEGPVPEMLAALCRQTGSRAPVRLTAAAACPTPIALGRSEICVPERFLTDLGPDEQRSALAHELAHLRRRDPLWQFTAGIVESVFFFQPLNRVARQHLRDAAENLSDDWAVRHTGSALGLARCLTDVASWICPTTIPQLTLAMAEGGPPLVRRVERLAQWKEPSVVAARLRPLASFFLLALVALVAPAASQRRAATTPDPQTEAVVENCQEQRRSNRSGSQVRHCEVRPYQMSARDRSLMVDGGENGAVSVRGWDGEEIRVSARVQTHARSEEEARALAREIRVHASDGRVSAQGPSRRNGAGWSVGYEILVPRRMDLNVETRNGPLAVSDVSGRMQLRAANGPLSLRRLGGAVNARASNGPLSVHLEGDRWQGEGLDAETTNGPVSLRIPEPYSAELEVGTVHGPTDSDLPLRDGQRRGGRIRTTLGAGGAPVRVVTTNGPLTVRTGER